ncbi:MAG: MFS transporter [Novosphingobium sp.]
MKLEKVTAAQEWKSGWTLVLASAVGFSFFSIMLSATGLFMGPLADEFGWSRTLLSTGPSIATVMTALLSPFFGMLIDRYGSRRMAIPGIILTMLATAAFGLANGSQFQWLALWFVFGLVAVSIKSTVWTAAVLGVFQKSRGLALGLTLAGTAVAQVIVPPLGNYLITEFGWRWAYVGLAAGWGGVTLILCLFFFFDARDRTARAAAKAGAPAVTASSVDLPGLTIAQARSDSALWRIGISNFVVMLLTMGLMMHLIPILTDAGVSRETAAWLSSLGGIAGIIGKLTTGWLLDRYRPNWTGGITLGAASVTFAVLMWGLHSPAWVIVGLIVNGYAAGTKTQITGFLTQGYAGMRNFGAIYGVMAAMMALAAGVGPMIAGAVYDLTGGYEPFLLVGAIGCAFGGIMIFSLPPYPRWDKDEPEAAVFS